MTKMKERVFLISKSWWKREAEATLNMIGILWRLQWALTRITLRTWKITLRRMYNTALLFCKIYVISFCTSNLC